MEVVLLTAGSQFYFRIMIKNYYKTSDVYADFVDAIAKQIERGIENKEEGKWDEGVIHIHTDDYNYEVRLTDPDEYQTNEGNEGFENGCVLVVATEYENDFGDAYMIGKWCDYDCMEDWIAETLLSYIDENEGPDNYDWIENAVLDAPRYGRPNDIWK